MSARDIFAALGGKRLPDGSYLVRCPCPGHGQGRGDRNPSCRVADGDKTILVKCFAFCPSEDVLHSLRAIGLLPQTERESSQAAKPLKPQAIEVPTPDAAASEIWNASLPPLGTPVETYLRNRGITLRIPPVLRFSRTKYSGIEYPAMVAALMDEKRQIIAVQQTLLTWDGRKADVAQPRQNTGRQFNCAVQLDTLPKGSPAIGLAEGIESALSAMQIHHMTVWAALGAARLPNVAFPPSVRELVVYGDNDGTGKRAANKTTDSHFDIRVTHVFPPAHKDWNAHLIASQRIEQTVAHG